jgi:hypothetical protein
MIFIWVHIGIWQRCQISRLFHEGAQGAQVLFEHLASRLPAGTNPPERESSIDETVVGLVDGHLFTILWGSSAFT